MDFVYDNGVWINQEHWDLFSDVKDDGINFSNGLSIFHFKKSEEKDCIKIRLEVFKGKVAKAFFTDEVIAFLTKEDLN